MSQRSVRALTLGGVISIWLAACSVFPRSPGLGWVSSDAYRSNGERIYFAARSSRGGRIRSRGGAVMGGMMGGQTCASCHGSDGRGGDHFMHMQLMDAPDIRWKTLSAPDHGDHGDEHGSEEEQAYDAAAFALALREGVTPSGAQLSPEMPRWTMSDADIEDLIAFLKTLP